MSSRWHVSCAKVVVPVGSCCRGAVDNQSSVLPGCSLRGDIWVPMPPRVQSLCLASSVWLRPLFSDLLSPTSYPPKASDHFLILPIDDFKKPLATVRHPNKTCSTNSTCMFGRLTYIIKTSKQAKSSIPEIVSSNRPGLTHLHLTVFL